MDDEPGMAFTRHKGILASVDSVFDQMEEPVEFTPKTGQMILFPAWLNHSVPKHTCDHERIKIAGNIDTAWDFKNRTYYNEL